MSLHTSVEMSCSTALEDRITMAAARSGAANPVEWMQSHKHVLCATEAWATAWEAAYNEYDAARTKYGLTEWPELGKTQDVISDQMILDAVGETMADDVERAQKQAEDDAEAERMRQEAARQAVSTPDTTPPEQ